MISKNDHGVLYAAMFDYQMVNSCYSYPLVICYIANWKIQIINGGLIGKIICFYGPFSSSLCEITRGYRRV